METQNQTQPQVQTHPQGQMQPEQNFDVKGALSKLDKYNIVLAQMQVPELSLDIFHFLWSSHLL